MNTNESASKVGNTVTVFIDGAAVASRNSKKDTPWASLYWNDGSVYGVSLHSTEAQATKAVAQALSAGWWNFSVAVEVAQ